MPPDFTICPLCRDTVLAFTFQVDHYPECIGAHRLGQGAGREACKAYGRKILSEGKSEPKESLSQEVIAPGDVAIGNP
jgi:hypothetical protein